MASSNRDATFRFSPDIVRRLGEELITSPEQAIIELVKNSYDANATRCRVELIETETPGGTVRISDNGDGMDETDIVDGWLLVGRSRKAPSLVTRLGRLPAGSKGLGRLAALRLGQIASVRTRPRSSPEIEIAVRIDWGRFETATAIEDVHLSVQRHASSKQSGTDLSLDDLTIRFSRADVRQLARELLLLRSPFESDESFIPELVGTEFEDLETLVRRGYLDDAEFVLKAEVDEDGRARCSVLDRSGKVRWSATPEELDGPYQTVPATFELWLFTLDGSSFARRTATVSEVRTWLQEVGGVHLYHRGLRVRPYGDAGHDWLDMNLLRARNPELRPSTNTAVGRVAALDPNEQLQQKTDRTGFLETTEFKELRRFAQDVLEWLARRRIAERERARIHERNQTGEETTRATSQLEHAVASSAANTSEKRQIRTAITRLRRSLEHQVRIVRDDLKLYRSLATVGTTASVFGHEIKGPVSDLEAAVRALRRRLPAEARSLEPVNESLNAVARSSGRIRAYALLPVAILERRKRSDRRLDLQSATRDAIHLLDDYLDASEVTLRDETTPTPTPLYGTAAAIESVVLNLVTNAVRALRDSTALPRVIAVRTQESSTELLLSVLDNGPGIRQRDLTSIWLPGVTRFEGGTGLGLTIVRDTVRDLGGDSEAVRHGELGGAEFLIHFAKEASNGARGHAGRRRR